MTPSQLERLGEKIGERWPEFSVKAYGSGLDVLEHQDIVVAYFVAQPDQENAEFIIWALTQLEELGSDAGHYPVLYRISPNQYRIALHDRPMCHAPTRAECVALALLAALESEHG